MNSRLPAYVCVQVHVRHWLCREAWFVACTCGVAVREGNTVLAVDMCGGKLKVRNSDVEM